MTAVLLIDDHAMFREALLLSLSQALPGVTVHPASNGAEALAVLQAQPQIGSVIMDYYLPDLGGSALLKRLKQLRPGIRVLVLSASEDPDDRERVMAAGAQGFLHKSADCRALLDALEQIGQPPRPDLAPAAAAPRKPPAPMPAPVDDMALLSALTPRQGEVLRLMCDGLRNREISERLSMTEKTVKTHVTAILATLGVVNRTQATLVARRGGLLGKPR